MFSADPDNVCGPTGDLVTDSHFWHVIRVMIGHDLTDKETMTNIKTFREQPPKRLVTL